MQLKRLNNLILLAILALPLALFSKEEQILSQDRLNLFNLEQKKLQEEGSKLKKDWINPIIYQFTKNLGEKYRDEKSIISVNQPIFKSGGIYKSIKYANSSYDYATLEIKQQKKALITQALNYLFLIRKSDLNIQKAKLSISNAQIDIKRKKEQVLNGFLDSSFLDKAILTLNESKHLLVNLKYQKKELIDKFHNLSSKDYTEFTLPTFKIYSEKEFIEKNIEQLSYMTLTKYLPTLNIFYNYSKNHYTDANPALKKGSSKNYGLTISVPFDTRVFNDIEARKIDYLKSKLSLKNKIEDEKTFFKTSLDKISMLDERIEITKDDLNTYNSILKTLKEEKEAQLKTQSDIDTLENSKNIKNLELEIFEIDRQITLLECYAKLK